MPRPRVPAPVNTAPPIWLLGDPVNHSLSPRFQNAALRHLGLPNTYRTRHTPASELADAVDAIRRGVAMGANVTLPHKRAVGAHLDGLATLATRAGAVNTIVAEGERLTGHNTDVTGLLRALSRWFVEGSPRTALLLGAGGAARGALLALERLGVEEVWIANRTSDAARALARELDTDMALHVGRARCDLVIHTTSLGVGTVPDTAEHHKAAEVWSDTPWAPWVYDVCYSAEGPTPFLAAAHAAGVTHRLDGLTMLVHQGADSLELWTGQPAPRELMLDAVGVGDD